eukprot:scaffold9104_cov100-Isochrysis_galbana.AAC.2
MRRRPLLPAFGRPQLSRTSLESLRRTDWLPCRPGLPDRAHARCSTCRPVPGSRQQTPWQNRPPSLSPAARAASAAPANAQGPAHPLAVAPRFQVLPGLGDPARCDGATPWCANHRPARTPPHCAQPNVRSQVGRPEH